jgi:hypothetical protein
MMTRRTLGIAGWVVAGVLGVVAVTGVATGSGRAPDAGTVDEQLVTLAADAVAGDAAADEATDRPGKRKAWGWWQRGAHKIARHVAHGELVVKTNDGFQTVVVQRGEVTAVSDDSVTVRSADGFTRTWKLDDETRVRKNHEKADAGAIVKGDPVQVAGPNDGPAKFVRVHP